MRLPHLRPLLACAVLCTFLTGGGMAQTFGPVITVNGTAITGFELDQREKFIRALRLPGDPASLARNALIEDRLKNQAAAAAGLTAGPDEIEQGLAEFAGRANLTTEEFIRALDDEGVAPETFRDFVRSGLLWRALVQQRFGPRARVSPAEVERALALAGTQSGARVRLAEIIIPAPPEQRIEAEGFIEDLRERIRTEADFTSAVQRFSAAPSRNTNGLRDWIALAELPGPLAQTILTLAPGEVSPVIPLGGQALALFQVRGFQETALQTQPTIAADIATLPLSTDPEAAARLRAQLAREIDVCDDLYGLARNLPEGVLQREVYAAEDIPRDLAVAIADLDNQETTEILGATGPIHVMLCARTTALTEDAEGTIERQLVNRRLASYAENYLEELRADATIK
ncbi:peptidylprolyl isomerase [Dinoroseobacter sp. S375]|uniref:peptidylprolyl isomerase n=1 Tax=Dinoroseobacter sp. S375 TaxID=3415136 RepID=UPI003C7991A8